MDATTAVGDILNTIKTYCWNPQTGQLFINIRLHNGQVVGMDYQTSGKTDKEMGVNPPRQDGHTTMRYLEGMYFWRQWKNDASYDAEIARAEAAVKTFFGPKPSNPRGWIFFDLLDMAKFNPFWKTVADALLAGWKTAPMPIKSDLGATGDPDSRTDHQIEIACAQMYSGDASGKARLEQAISLNLNPHGIPWDHGEVKSGEIGQEIEALQAIGDPRAQQWLAAMDYLLMPAGGYYAKDAQQTGIQNTKTEPGRSSEMLRAAWQCSDATRTANLLSVVLNHVYHPELHGVVYECKPDWSLFTTSVNTPEDWVTTEAMGITMGALLRVAMSQQPVPPPVPVPTPIPVPTPVPTPTPAPAPAPALVAALQQYAEDMQQAAAKLAANLPTTTGG